MCAKQLYVKSNGQWVAAGGAGGSVDTNGLATEQFVTDAIGAGGFATITDLNDALAAIPEAAITAHAGAVPEPTSDTPQGLEDAFSVLTDGLHYYKDVGSLVSITRQEYQTTITLTGQLSSFAKIVKSEAGLPTPENPSLIVMQRPEGQWLKLTSDGLDESFGNPQRVDIFALGGGDPSTVDLSDYYTKPEVEGLVAGKADQSEFAAFQGQYGTLEAEFREYFRLLNQGFATVAQKPDVDAALELKADKAETYTKLEVDAAIGDSISGQLTPAQIEEIVSQVGPVDLTAYAKSEDVYAKTESDTKYATKEATTLIGTQLQAIFDSIYTRPESDDRYAAKSDNTQNVVTNGVVAKGYTFGDSVSASNPGLVYTDTGEGYGPRLALDTPGGVELIPYQSDFAPIRSRLDALESKAAPGSGVQDVSALATKESVDLLRSQLQAIFDGMYTRPEADARYAAKDTTYTKTECDSKFLTIVDVNQYAYQANVYTQRQADDRFMRIDQAFSKTDFDNQMALMLYSRKQVDDKLTAISPLGANSVNDPALADFKKSVLDEVKLMLVGGTKMPPPDIDWTWMVRMDGARESVSTEIQARMIGGFIELKGTLAFNAGSGAWVPLRLPPQFPLAELEASYPLAMRLVGSAVTYGYCTVSKTNRDISVSPGARSSEAAFSGIRWKAAY